MANKKYLVSLPKGLQLKLILISLLVAITVTTAASTSAAKRAERKVEQVISEFCADTKNNDLTGHCDCARTSYRGTDKIICYPNRATPEKFFEITGNHIFLEITCQNVDKKVFYNTPGLQLHKVEHLHFSGCEVPDEELSDIIIRRLQLQKLNMLAFTEGVLDVANYDGLIFWGETYRESLRSFRMSEMRFKNAKENHFPVDAFSSYANIQFLSLVNNKIKRIIPGTFAALHKIRSLFLNDNGLEDVTKDDFIGLKTLDMLDLSGNRLHKLQRNVFHLLPNLDFIMLDRNYFNTLPERLFEKNKILRRISIKNNLLDLHLPDYFLSNKHELIEINFKGSNISELPEKLFGNSLNLKRLGLTYNKLKTLPADIFSNLYDIIEIDLSHNLIEELPEGIFRDQGQMHIVKLSYNQLEQIEEDLLSPLIYLREIYFDHNRLKYIAPNAFLKCHNLELAEMSHNDLDFGDDGQSPFDQLPELRKLTLEGNPKVVDRGFIFVPKYLNRNKPMY